MKFKDTKYGDLTGSTYDGNIDVSKTNITSLEGAPKIVNGSFYCHNTKLTSLEGAPNTVNGKFWCYITDITSLEGAPKTVQGFYCHNTKLTSLEGAPKIIKGSFWCYGTKISQDDVWTLLDLDISGEIKVPKGLKTITKDDYTLYNRLHKNLKKFIKIKELKAKLK